MNDIDLSDTEWKQIPVFIGTLDGNGHKIMNFHQSGDVTDVGFIDDLYSSSESSRIYGLTFENVDIDINYIGGKYQQYSNTKPCDFGIICNHIGSSSSVTT